MSNPFRGVLLLRFAPNEIPPPEVPIELRLFYTKEVWNSRLPAVIRKASRYYKRRFELAWFLIFLAFMIAVPIAMYYVALRTLPETKADKAWAAAHANLAMPYMSYWQWHSYDRVWQARTIGFCAWIAVALLYYLPIVFWKNSGRKSVNKMLQAWENEDRAARATDVPIWTLRYIGIFTTMVKIEINYPINPESSSFHPTAYLPTYIVNAPRDPYYPYPQSQYPTSATFVNQQMPQQNPPSGTLSAVPLYDDNREKGVGYPRPNSSQQ